MITVRAMVLTSALVVALIPAHARAESSEGGLNERVHKLATRVEKLEAAARTCCKPEVRLFQITAADEIIRLPEVPAAVTCGQDTSISKALNQCGKCCGGDALCACTRDQSGTWTCGSESPNCDCD